MSRESYRVALAELSAAVVEMGELALSRYEDAVGALATGDDELATAVVEGDDELDRRHREIEQDCIDLLALQQPVAGDLRFVAASFKITTDLERIGDLATNLAAHAHSKSSEVFPEVNIRDLAAIAGEMVEKALAAYEAADPDLCHAVAEQDDELDGLCQRVLDLVIGDLLDRNPEEGTEVLLSAVDRLLLTVRDLERVGDHAVNVAARTLYMVENDEVLLY